MATWDFGKKTVIGADGGFNAENFARQVIREVGVTGDATIKGVHRIAVDAIVKEQEGFFRFLGRYINAKNPFGPLGVPWTPLSPDYLRRKRKNGKGFFKYKGHLGRNLISKSGKRLGDPVVDVKKSFDINTGVPTFILTIDLFTALGRTFDLETIETRFATKRLITPLSKRKLIGRAEYHRPLLAPALEFYRNRIGSAVFEALRKAGYAVDGTAHTPRKPRTRSKAKKTKSTPAKQSRRASLDLSPVVSDGEGVEDTQSKIKRLRRVRESIGKKTK